VFQQDERIEEMLRVEGGGGTILHPMFKHIYEKHQDVEAIVVLTDLYTSSDDFAECDRYAEVPTLWVSTSRHAEAPFGTTVYIT